MESEASKFETSEMLADFLASTPLLLESWKLCNLTYSNSTVPGSFVIDQVGEVGYVGFSAVQNVTELNLIENQLVQIDSGVFSCLKGGDEVPPMVHAGFLHLFISVYSNNPEFQNKMLGLLEKCKAIVFTGHGIGGAIATLAALWLKSHSSNHTVICFTFGSPLLGNEPLAKVILREKWGGNFFNVVSKHDIVPRLLFAPLTFVTGQQLDVLPQLWVLAMTSQRFGHLASQLSDNYEMHALHQHVSGHLVATTTALDNTMRSPYSPFGNYVFCSNEGAICIDNISAVEKMLHLLFIGSTVNSSITDHLSYGEVVMRVSQQFLKRRGFTQGVNMSDSSSEIGIASALGALGIPNHPQVDLIAQQAWECLKKARQTGFTPNRNSVDLTRKLGKITPNRAQIEWYKASCDNSDDQMGYYDSFKLIRPSKKDSHVNMNRHKLASFWNNVIRMVENNELPHDFHKRPKWVNASQFYKLLVEPLDIADYYRSGMHRTKGHYMKHGRERRYEIFDKWWTERKVTDEEQKKRAKYAGSTQDSCFWARVEEASEWVKNIRTQNDTQKLAQLWEKIDQFEQYALSLVERKEVSIDVVAKNSSYSLWVEELKELKSQFMQRPPRSMFPGHVGGDSSLIR